MKKNLTWLIVSCLLVAALVLSSCQAATVEEEKETETVTGKVTEKEAAKVEEEGKEVVVEEAGPEMVRDPSTGEMVEKPQYGGTVTLTRTADPASWDKWWRGDRNIGTQGAVFEVLSGGNWATPRSKFDFSTTFIPPNSRGNYSMESYENPDPLTYIVHIREGMRFQNKPPVNGREVTAQDFKNAVDRMQGLGEYEGAGSPSLVWPSWTPVESVEVVDKYTFVFHMKKPHPMFTESWGSERMPLLIPREVVDTYGNDFPWEAAVGSGPFMVEDYVPSSSIVLKKHPGYYGRDEKFPENQLPYVDTINYLLMSDASTRLAALRTGKIEMHSVGWEDALDLQETNPELKWKKLPGGNTCFTMRVDLEPWSDIRVRKAMQMAVNLEEMSEVFYGGTTDPYWMILSPVFTDYYTPPEELPGGAGEAFTYNPEKARELLAEAGYPNGFKQVMPMNAQSDTIELLLAYMDAIGIETEIKMMERAVYDAYARDRSRNTGVTPFGNCQRYSPPQVFKNYHPDTRWNYANVDDPVYNQLFDDIHSEPDDAERDRLLKELNAYATSQFYTVCGPCTVYYRFWPPWLKGYQGEVQLRSWPSLALYARVWIDQDLKYEMTGTRD